MGDNREKRITTRFAQNEYETVCAKAQTAFMSASAYIRAAALRHKIVVIPGIKEMSHELKSIGRNLNRIVTLANMERIKVVRLDETLDLLYKIYVKLEELSDAESR